MTKYKLQETPYGQTIIMIRDEVISFIPPDPANTDYQAYLEWLEAGNEPEVVE
jgi:hypothetical protein